jgi:hypothetical protein
MSTFKGSIPRVSGVVVLGGDGSLVASKYYSKELTEMKSHTALVDQLQAKLRCVYLYCVCMYVCICIVCVCMCVFVLCVCVCVYLYCVCVCVYLYCVCVCVFVLCVCVCICIVCVCVCVVYMNIYALSLSLSLCVGG